MDPGTGTAVASSLARQLKYSTTVRGGSDNKERRHHQCTSQLMPELVFLYPVAYL